MSKEHPYLGPWILLKPPVGVCPECGKSHDATQPHNPQSLMYQYNFYGKNGRWPDWTDAMAHCEPEVKAQWIEELQKLGVVVRTKEEMNNAED